MVSSINKAEAPMPGTPVLFRPTKNANNLIKMRFIA